MQVIVRTPLQIKQSVLDLHPMDCRSVLAGDRFINVMTQAGAHDSYSVPDY